MAKTTVRKSDLKAKCCRNCNDWGVVSEEIIPDIAYCIESGSKVNWYNVCRSFNWSRREQRGNSSISYKMHLPKKIYIGIDPDLRKLSAAIVTDDKKPLAVFLRRNKEGKDDQAVVNAAYLACRLVEDVIAYILSEAELFDPLVKAVTIVESQSMMHTKHKRDKGKKIKYEDILRVGQVAGCLMGAFSNMSEPLYLVQPILWKGNVPKDKAHNFMAHRRYYKTLGIAPVTGLASCIYPVYMDDLCKFSEDKINPGDFADINDSLGLALYGVKKML